MAFRLCRKSAFLQQIIAAQHNARPASSTGGTTGTRGEEKVAITDDGSTIVCWHPEPHFPYEFSRPLPQEMPQSDSALKVQSLAQVREIFKPKAQEFVRQELQNITYTTKHRWFPRSRDKRAKKTPPDREYL